MKKALLIGCFALGITPAFAADFPIKAAPSAPIAPRPIYDWSGIYLGINGGGGQSHDCWNMNGALVFGFSAAISEGCNNGTGGIAGGQVGYRYQMNSFVFGLEAQGDWADLSGSNASSVFSGITLPRGTTVSLTNSSKVDAIGMFTGQAGYSFGPLLWYVKGGAAVTNNKFDGALNVSAGGASLTATDHADAVKFGGTVGTGLEYIFANGWSVGAEYNHLFMGSQNVGLAVTSFATTPAGVLARNLFAPGTPSRNDKISQDIDMATVRLNYRFGAQ